MVKKQQGPSTPAAGSTPWKGRLRSHHPSLPLSSPSPWTPSGSRIRHQGEDAHRRFKKQAAASTTTPGTGRRRCSRDEGGGSVRRPSRSVPARRSPRFQAGRDTEHPIALDETDKECEVRGNQSAITPVGRSVQFHRGDKSLSKPLAEKESHHKKMPCTPKPRDTAFDKKTQNTVKKDGKRGNATSVQRSTAVRSSARIKNQDPQEVPARRETPDASCKKSEIMVEKEIHQKKTPFTPKPWDIALNKKTQNTVKKDKKRENPTSVQRSTAVRSSARIKNQDSQEVHAMRKTPDASCKKSEMQEPKPSSCERSTRKRKRGVERKQIRKQSQPEVKSAYQETLPITEPRNIIQKKSGHDPSPTVQAKIGDDTLVNTKECNKELSGIKGGIQQQRCASDDWTEEQDLTLRQAYFTARPSPHFWKKVSKMVSGKSAEECFNRVHADLSTPTPIAPRPRRSKIQFSPLGHFTLSDSKIPNLLEPLVQRRTAKQKSLAAQKTVRHLLKKQSLIDQAQEADHFSIFETSPSALQLNITIEDSPGTPDNYLNSFSLNKYSLSSSARKRPLSRLNNKQAEPSPAVLKPIKNVVLHEKYINQLSRREGAKNPRKKAAGTKATDPEGPPLEQQAGVVKAAKNALMSEATDFICQFKKLQANSLAHVLENSEDDENSM